MTGGRLIGHEIVTIYCHFSSLFENVCWYCVTTRNKGILDNLSKTSVPIVDRGSICKAADIVRSGGLVAFPTETVYGLGADASNDEAVASLFAVKERPSFNPLIVHVPRRNSLEDVARCDARSLSLADRFWPGPLTMVLPRSADSNVSWLASSGLDTVAVRMPDHSVALELLAKVNGPVVAPSANMSGSVSPTTAEHVQESLKWGVEMIIDGGPCRIGIESTVISLVDNVPCILRPGGISREVLEEEIGAIVSNKINGLSPLAPGMLESHYAPSRPVRINVTEVMPGEALLAFGPSQLASDSESLNLSPSGDLEEAASNLFSMLRRLDRAEFVAVAVMTIPESGIGRAINDRLRRAAATPLTP